MHLLSFKLAVELRKHSGCVQLHLLHYYPECGLAILSINLKNQYNVERALLLAIIMHVITLCIHVHNLYI